MSIVSSAFCQLRQSERAFRLDRIDAWRLLDETFTPRTVIPEQSKGVVARIPFAPHVVRCVRERQFVVSNPALDNTRFLSAWVVP